jgi:ComF family protein
MHWRRQLRRGYNQSALLAGAAARALGLPLVAGGLARCRRSRPQVGLSGEQRRANVAGVFAVRRPWPIAGARLVLVDDVYTTGATLRECARTLRDAGASVVYGLTVTTEELGTHPAPLTAAETSART